MRKREITLPDGRKATEITYDASDSDDVAKFSLATVAKGGKDLPEDSKEDAKRTKPKKTGKILPEDVSDVAKAAFDGAKALGMSDEEAGLSAMKKMIESRPMPTIGELNDRIDKSKRGYLDFAREVDLIAERFSISKVAAHELAARTFEPVA